MINKPNPPRRTHRKRVSALQLSSDTTATLPEYYQSSAGVHSWQRHIQETSLEDDTPSDKPPDYSDSAEEADEDTDSEDHRNIFFVQQQPLTGAPTTLQRTPHSAAATVPSRRKQRLQHKRKHSAPPQLTHTVSETSPVDPFLDALLERSVHALEMSNTLLQSSITAQTSLSTVLACDSPADQTLEARAINLSAKIGSGSGRRAAWMDDLEEITRGVDSLFGDGQDMDEGGVGPEGGKIRSQEDWSRHLRSSPTYPAEVGVSCSLPASTSLLHQDPRRRPSLDLREAAAVAAAESSGEARLRLSHRTREDLIAPPPRALTQYIESDADPAIIALPSTLGIRSNGSIHLNAEWNGSTASLHSSPALPIVTETLLPSSSTPAYTKLASFVIKRPSNSANTTPTSSFTSSFMVKRRNSSAGTPERGRRKASPKPSPRRSIEFFRSQTSPGPTLLSHQHRPMTPTAEESSSSSSSDGCVAKQTISNLRKILDEHRVLEDSKSVASSSTSGTARAKPAPIPLTPPPAPVSGTSTATASISRMLTKKVHHSSTRPPSPPRQSAMKGSRPATPSSTTAISPSPTSPTAVGMTLGVPERLTIGVKGLQLSLGSKSASSSGRSTPKRISFAELPEAHVSSRPEKFRDKKKRKVKSKAKANGKEDDEDSPGKGWFTTWFGGGGSMGGTGFGGGPGMSGLAYVARQEERMEDRISRSWGGRGGGGSGYFDEWAV